MRARESLEAHGSADEQPFSRLGALLRYVDGDYRDPATFQTLKRELAGADGRRTIYLAIPPALFGTVVSGLPGAGDIGDARVVIEKPFGRNIASARELNRTRERVR